MENPLYYNKELIKIYLKNGININDKDSNG